VECDIPLWVKLAATLFVAVLVPVYWKTYGLANFLWFSDIALFVTTIALWAESSLLASMMAIAVLLPELGWNVSFFGSLIFRRQVLGLTFYMFNPKYSRFQRALSLFHVVLPPLLLWMVWCLGYEPAAWLAQTALAWIVLPITYFFTDPQENINWVFGPGEKPQNRIPRLAYFLLVLLFYPLCIYLPTHLLLQLIL
jgi:hypothetical protein